jgi:hypothetical protein
MAWIEHTRNCYRVRLRHDGRLITDSVFGSQEAAQARVAALHAAAQLVRRQLDPGPPPTLHQWVKAWLPAHTASPATLAKYRSLLDTHILPAFGRHRLNAITRTDVKAFACRLGHHLAPASVRAIVTLLGLPLREAIDEHYLHFGRRIQQSGKVRFRTSTSA